MKPLIMICLAALTLGFATPAQTTKKTPTHPPDTATVAPEKSAPAEIPDDVQQLNADLQRLKVLLNQMRSNLAFVQSSQTPLKHQLELETDAWQVVVEQMERRVQRAKDRGTPANSTPHAEPPSRD